MSMFPEWITDAVGEEFDKAVDRGLAMAPHFQPDKDDQEPVYGAPQWRVIEPEPSAWITEGTRLRITRGNGEPDLFMIVDDVKRDGHTMRLTVHREDVPPIDSELLRYYEPDA